MRNSACIKFQIIEKVNGYGCKQIEDYVDNSKTTFYAENLQVNTNSNVYLPATVKHFPMKIAENIGCKLPGLVHFEETNMFDCNNECHADP